MRLISQALTFDDVLLVPAHSKVLPKNVSLSTSLTKNISLKLPLISAAMDTVTEARLAIVMAQEGGIGVIHKNMTIEQQAKQVRTVKKFENGIVKEPITVTPQTTVSEVLAMGEKYGFSGFPVIDNGALCGIVTSRDVRFAKATSESVTTVMTPKEKLVTIDEHATRDDVLQALHSNRIEKILMVNKEFQLRGLVTVRDILQAKENPMASKDDDQRLRVAAAVGTGEESDERVMALVEAGVDVIFVDTAHGHSQGVIDRVAWVKKHAPKVQIVAGNIATAAAAKALAKAGADAVKVGIGPGSICTTRIVTGVGVPQITAISNVAEGLKGTDVKVIADGGIRFSGDLSKAIAAGADCVMVGSLFAGTEESPGEVELYKGRTYKSYRGMGSLGAMSQAQGSSDRYFQDPTKDQDKLVPEGIEGRVPYKGPLQNVIFQLSGGLRSGMGYVGCETLPQLQKDAEFMQVSAASMRESHVHDVRMFKTPPNYQIQTEGQ